MDIAEINMVRESYENKLLIRSVCDKQMTIKEKNLRKLVNKNEMREIELK